MNGAALKWLQIVTATVAIVAFGLSIANLDNLNTSRRDAARDSCYLLRGLVNAATTRAPAQRRAAEAYIARTPLRDCVAYARKLVP